MRLSQATPLSVEVVRSLLCNPKPRTCSGCAAFSSGGIALPVRTSRLNSSKSSFSLSPMPSRRRLISRSVMPRERRPLETSFFETMPVLCSSNWSKVALRESSLTLLKYFTAEPAVQSYVSTTTSCAKEVKLPTSGVSWTFAGLGTGTPYTEVSQWRVPAVCKNSLKPSKSSSSLGIASTSFWTSVSDLPSSRSKSATSVLSSLPFLDLSMYSNASIWSSSGRSLSKTLSKLVAKAGPTIGT
mmetsp:Transcript_72044/g.166894  ORF Transcript_72044/g.166894 Transcript_72044/m.166894 type:complete len:242 (-) Transcript_72044:694-1419(-)